MNFQTRKFGKKSSCVYHKKKFSLGEKESLVTKFQLREYALVNRQLNNLETIQVFLSSSLSPSLPPPPAPFLPPLFLPFLLARKDLKIINRMISPYFRVEKLRNIEVK